MADMLPDGIVITRPQLGDNEAWRLVVGLVVPVGYAIRGTWLHWKCNVNSALTTSDVENAGPEGIGPGAGHSVIEAHGYVIP